ncbi:unnamed protein product [Symbiodinium sp. CCMP2592]|nr:unnamed protein product [Symbiodinium sp. CCMP2592]
MTPLAHGIGQAFAGRMHSLNEIDFRQWEEVQRYCGIAGPDTGKAGRESKGGRGRRGR